MGGQRRLMALICLGFLAASCGNSEGVQPDTSDTTIPSDSASSETVDARPAKRETAGAESESTGSTSGSKQQPLSELIAVRTDNAVVELDIKSGAETELVKAGSQRVRRALRRGTDGLVVVYDQDGGGLVREFDGSGAITWESFGFAAMPSPTGEELALVSFGGLDVIDSGGVTSLDDRQALGGNVVDWTSDGRVVWTYQDESRAHATVLATYTRRDTGQWAEPEAVELGSELYELSIATEWGSRTLVSACTQINAGSDSCTEWNAWTIGGDGDLAVDERVPAGARLGGVDTDRLLFVDKSGTIHVVGLDGQNLATLRGSYSSASW